MGGTVKVPPMLSKRCHDCGEVKPATEFWKNKASKDGLAYYCRRCFGLRNSRSYRKLQAKLGNKPRPYRRRSDVPEGMKYCPRCQETKPVAGFGKNRAKTSGLTAYCRPCHAGVGRENKRLNHGSERNYLLKLRYGVTEERVNQMIAAQGGICVICLRGEPKHVDHSHLTGLLRGVLCFKCNGGLGQFSDDPRCLGDAADYLEFDGPHAYRMTLELGVPAIDGHAHRRAGVTLSGEKVRLSGSNRQNHLRQKYGIHEQDARWLLDLQGGWCAICGDAPAEHVDHDHETGAVRGMACGGCNTGMGQFGDDPLTLRRAADYLLGELVKEISLPGGATRLSFTLPDVDPATVPAGGWEPHREADGRHRRKAWTEGDGEGRAWVDLCLEKIFAALAESAGRRRAG